ncbi:hypothetical protein EVAR_25506_1 [Eumeta japonica]|uniref:Uncharacterized protein n=1 Tax=Eumeta variegata TaxID=151549 RepID=A0A4C1VMP3_EUMVA|nr:hypothetical protein EVAR_25506_1 [Eumeta japonica]
MLQRSSADERSDDDASSGGERSDGDDVPERCAGARTSTPDASVTAPTARKAVTLQCCARQTDHVEWERDAHSRPLSFAAVVPRSTSIAASGVRPDLVSHGSKIDYPFPCPKIDCPYPARPASAHPNIVRPRPYYLSLLLFA